jgi:hypothetical protein
MKIKKIIAIAGIVTLSTLNIMACGKSDDEDTGVIIGAVDSGNDSGKTVDLSKDTTVKSDDVAIDNNEEQEEEQVYTEDITEENFSLYGTWVSVRGDTMMLTPAGNFSGFIFNSDGTSGENVNGTYTTDNETYINVLESDRYEIVETQDEEGNTVTEQQPLDDREYNFTIKSMGVGNDITETYTYLMTVELNGVEIDLRKDMSLESNYDDSFYDYETATVDEEIKEMDDTEDINADTEGVEIEVVEETVVSENSN